MQMQTPYGSPDSLRQFLQLSKKFYQLHTRMNVGYEDCDGLQYSGSIQNFGAELLLEARKLKMRKPPIPVIRPSEYFSYYFNISYSDFIDSYRQPNMIMGCVKKDVMLSNHTYKLVFENCTILNVNRAEAYSDSDVHISKFYHTYSNPMLVVDNSEMYPIYIGDPDNSDRHAHWFFAINSTTEGLYTTTEVESIFTIETMDLKSYVDLPFIWVCDAQMNMYPPFTWTTQTSFGDFLVLEHGVDGNDIDHLYPLTYTGIPNDGMFWYLKAYGDFFQNKKDERNYGIKLKKIEFIQCERVSFTFEPSRTETFEYDDEYVKVSLHKIKGSLGWEFRIPQQGDYDYDSTTYNNPMVACIPLNRFTDNTPSAENPDPILLPAFDVIFDDRYYHKFESEINQFRTGIHLDNTTEQSKHTVDKHNTIVYDLAKFDGIPKYYLDTLYRHDMGATTNHTHIDLYAIRDYANEANKNVNPMNRQTAALLIDSGVPINETTPIDSGMKPVLYYDRTQTRTYSTKQDYIISDVNFLTNIVYVDDQTFGDKTMEKYNNASPFVYHGNGHFSLGMIEFDPSINYGRNYLLTNDKSKYENNAVSRQKKAELTAARICDIPTSFMQLQNISGTSPTLVIDDKYVRQTASFKKDDYLNLWNSYVSRWVKFGPAGVSPSAHFIATDMWFLNHYGDPDFIKRKNGNVIYNYSKNNILFTNVGDISRPELIKDLTDAGEGYDEGDILGFNIGGRFFKIIVESVTGTGAIDSWITVSNTDIPDQDQYLYSYEIPLANFDDYRVTYDLSTISGSGSGAKLTVTVPDYVWNAFKATEIFDEGTYYFSLTTVEPTNWENVYYNYYTQSGSYPNYTYTKIPEAETPPEWEAYTYFERVQAYKRTHYPTPNIAAIYSYMHYKNNDGISVIGFNSNSRSWDESTVVQLTGDMEVGDVYYDDTRTKQNRTVSNTFLRNILTNQNFEMDYILGDLTGEKVVNLYYKNSEFEPPEITIEKIQSNEDLSQLMNDSGMNVWNAFLTLVPSTDLQSYYAISWSYDTNASYLYRGNNENLWFPSRSDNVHVNDYDNSWSSIKFNKYGKSIVPYMYDIMHNTLDKYSYDGNVLKLTAQRNVRLPDILTMTDYPPAQALHNGSGLNFNLYRYDHLYILKQNKEKRKLLYNMPIDQLYNYAVELFGENNILTRYYSYNTIEYASNTLYSLGTLITQHITSVDYEMQHIYPIDTMILDTTTNELYRAVKAFVSAFVDQSIPNYLHLALERDLALHNIEYVSKNPEYPEDKMYRALKTFTSTTIAEDLENGNMTYIGISSKAKYIVNYIIQNQPIDDHVCNSGEVKLYNEKDTILNIPEDDAIGGFVPLLDTVDDMNTVDGTHVNVDPVYIFRMDNFDIDRLNNFRMYDGDIDISEQTLLIIKYQGQYREYLFHNNQWEWNYHS